MLTMKHLARRVMRQWERRPDDDEAIRETVAKVKPEKLLWALMQDDPTYATADVLACLIELQACDCTSELIAKADELKAVTAGLLATAEPRVLREIDAILYPDTETE